ncbi:porin [Rhodoferax sp.]|uniref:porin n=1 Tax=Rhodoferax sp. TaxID=50421 RepID=UPI00277A33C9|nr:porin [Rhodoferax sp.]
MKHIATVAALLALAAGTASAQSSVTLFGIVDVNLRNVNNSGVGGNTTMNNNGLSSSRFGFRGVEDLGDGLKAGFWLESDINPDTGTTNPNGKFFARRSTVSLMGKFGEVRIGRDLTPSGSYTYGHDPFGVIGVGGSANIARFIAQPTFFRSDNSISYIMPKIGGLYGSVMIAPGEGLVLPSTTNLARKYAGGRFGYAQGPIDISVAAGSTVVDATGGKFKTTGIGAAYDMGVVHLMGHYYWDKLTTAGKENRLSLGLTAPFGAHQIRASYNRSDATGGTAAWNANDASQLAVGYVHNLSKRTAMYGTVARISNKGAATFAISGGTPGKTITPGGSSSGYEFGVRHSF